MFLKKSLKKIVVFFCFFIVIKVFGNENIQNIKVGFSPGETAKILVINVIKNALNSIDLAAYSFTNDEIAFNLIKSKKRGIKIRIVIDKKMNEKEYTAVTYLVNHKINLKLDGKYVIMHNKFILVDKTSIQTGSFNYTKSAVSRNAENVIYLKEIIFVAKKYKEEFEKLWQESAIFNSKY